MFAVVETTVPDNEVTDVILCNTDEEYAEYLQERFDLSEEDAAEVAEHHSVYLTPVYNEDDSVECWQETTAKSTAECQLVRMKVTDKRE